MDYRIGWSTSFLEIDQSLSTAINEFEKLVLLGYGVIEIKLNEHNLNLAEDFAGHICNFGCHAIIIASDDVPPLQIAETNRRLSQMNGVRLLYQQAKSKENWMKSGLPIHANDQLKKNDVVTKAGLDQDIHLEYFYKKCLTNNQDHQPPPYFAYLKTCFTNGFRANSRHLQLLAEDMSERNFHGPIICKSDGMHGTPSEMISLARDLFRKMDKIDWIRFQ